MSIDFLLIYIVFYSKAVSAFFDNHIVIKQVLLDFFDIFIASKYSKLFKVNKELEDQNGAIQQKQKRLSAKNKELSEVTGWFKGRKKKQLQKEIDELKSQIRDMKDYLPRIVQKIGYRSVQDFLKDFKASQTEYSGYRTAIAKWKKETGKEPVAHGIRAKLAEKKQEIQNEQKNKQHTRSQNKDRGAR